MLGPLHTLSLTLETITCKNEDMRGGGLYKGRKRQRTLKQRPAAHPTDRTPSPVPALLTGHAQRAPAQVELNAHR